MFFWVLLDCNKKVLVPINWCKFSEASHLAIYNNGSIGKRIVKLFYSANIDADANFDIEISDRFIENINGCYSGKILNCYATKIDALLAGVIEGSINDALADKVDIGTEIKEEDEEEKRKRREQQIELLEKSVTFLRRRLGINDILDGELNDFQDVLDDGEDDMEPFANDLTSTSNNTQQIDDELTVNGQTFDQLSGYMDFSIAQNGDRIYTDANVTIRKACVDMWLYLNSDIPFNGPTYDEKFVRGLLVEMFEFEKLAKLEMETSKLEFIRDIFSVRVLQDGFRLSKFEQYVAKKCDECKQRFQSNQQFYSQLKK